jgi:hypothetical protein
MKNLRLLVWLYLLLLIFEGALRKWILPMFDAPLLIIRDPVVILIYILAIQQGISFKNAFFAPNLALAIVTAITATIFGIGNGFITIYGLRTNYLQMPLIFLIPKIINRNDVIAMGRFLLWISIPMSALVILQFRSPVDSFWNKGAMATHYNTVRPSAVFSFVSGTVAFFDLVAVFIFFAFLEKGVYKVWLVAAATFCVLIASACSGSRSCFVSISIVAGFAVLCVLIRGRGGVGMLIGAAMIGIAFSILSSMSVFQEGSDQLQQRFSDAARNESFMDRGLSGFIGPFGAILDTPLFGDGLGLGTNAAAVMLSGEREFIGPENEWGRLLFECGPILGVMLWIFRSALTLTLVWQGFLALRRGNVLPLLIFAACGLLVLNGQWGVPSTLGFAVFGAGITLAACVEPVEEEHEVHEEGPADGEMDEPESAHATR